MSEEKEHKRKESMFHSMKKTIWKGTAVTDPQYESARTDFLTLVEIVIKLKGHINTWMTNVKNTLASSNTVAITFGDILLDAPKPNPYTIGVSEMKRQRTDAIGERSEGRLIIIAETTCLNRINNAQDDHKVLQERCTERQHLRSELDYYSAKVERLREERDKRTGQGKELKSKDVEKLGRNENKLEKFRVAYESHNEILVKELNERWNTRAITYGPIMNDFLALERAYQKILTDMTYESAATKAMVAAAALIPKQSVAVFARATSVAQSVKSNANAASVAASSEFSNFDVSFDDFARSPSSNNRSSSSTPNNAASSSSSSSSSSVPASLSQKNRQSSGSSNSNSIASNSAMFQQAQVQQRAAHEKAQQAYEAAQRNAIEAQRQAEEMAKNLKKNGKNGAGGGAGAGAGGGGEGSGDASSSFPENTWDTFDQVEGQPQKQENPFDDNW